MLLGIFSLVSQWFFKYFTQINGSIIIFLNSLRVGNFFRESQTPQAQVDGQQPPMMSFKAFLATQDDNISDSEAIEKYNDYKLEFQRQQLNEFFVAHKDDEW